MANYLKNKKIGFYFVAANIILALFVGLFFFATYKNFPAGYGGIGMSSNAYAHVPEVIGLFLILGAIFDIILLVLPEFLWIQVAAIAAFCISLMKQVYCIPNLIADEINQVHYQGGSLPLCLSWLIITLIIIGLSIAVLFLGILKPEDEETLKKEKIAGKKLIKVATCGGVAVMALVVIMSVYGVTAANIAKGSASKDTFAQRVKARLVEFKDQIGDYDFNPDDCKFTKEDNPYSAMTSSQVNSAIGEYAKDEVRKDSNGNEIHKVYVFEGATAEGWQGDYSLKISRITLWEDGLYNGRNTNGGSTTDNLKGYWYNVNEFGEDCLVLVSTSNSFNMVGNKITGSSSYYEWFVDVHANYNTQQGGRYIKANGLKYQPLIGMFVDTGSSKKPEFKVGGSIDMSEWTCVQVRNNLVAGSIFDAEHEVKWTYRAADADEDAKWSETPDMSQSGAIVAKATWQVDKLALNALVDDKGTASENDDVYYYETTVEINIVE